MLPKNMEIGSWMIASIAFTSQHSLAVDAPIDDVEGF